jgi:uncharacterized membrane protein
MADSALVPILFIAGVFFFLLFVIALDDHWKNDPERQKKFGIFFIGFASIMVCLFLIVTIMSAGL